MTHKIFKLGEQHDTPVGASFAPSAWIGPFVAAHTYAVGWVQMDLGQLYLDHNADMPTALEEVDELTGKAFVDLIVKDGTVADFVRESSTEKHKYYYRDVERAQVAARLINKEEPLKFDRKPEHRWRLEAPVAGILTLTDDAKAKFESDVVAWEVEQKGIVKNSKDWWAWHGLVLPLLVDAYARLSGWSTPGFSVDEFLVPDDEFSCTDELQERLIGNTDIGYDQSALYKRRAELWKALGEDDPKKSDPDSTESEKLSEALNVAVSDWQAPVFCRVVHLPSPRVDDVWEGRDNRRIRTRVPVITDFYPTKGAAEAAAKAERPEAEVATGGKPSSDGTGALEVPQDWAEFPDEWKKTVATVKQEVTDGQPRPVPVIKKALEGRAEQLMNDYAVTPAEILAWWDEVE